MSPTRVRQPLCVTCSHPRSFHGDGGPCQALGCVDCPGYLSPFAPVDPSAESTVNSDAQ